MTDTQPHTHRLRFVYSPERCAWVWRCTIIICWFEEVVRTDEESYAMKS